VQLVSSLKRFQQNFVLKVLPVGGVIGAVLRFAFPVVDGVIKAERNNALEEFLRSSIAL
jgi:hypothetical protein